MSRMEEAAALASRELIEEKWLAFVKHTPIGKLRKDSQPYITTRQVFYQGAKGMFDIIVMDATVDNLVDGRIEKAMGELIEHDNQQVATQEVEKAFPKGRPTLQ